MTNQSFFDAPILNSPYVQPARHWELDENGMPTGRCFETRRMAKYLQPVPKPRKQKRATAKQSSFILGDERISTARQQYDPTAVINEVRGYVNRWRQLHPSLWQVTPTTERLLQHWRTHEFQNQRPFFCQIEAVETAIWLTEVAPSFGAQGKRFTEYLAQVNDESNPGLSRLALKLATGAGKTTVMAMLIAWQTVNAVRHPNSKMFTRGFLVVAPGITIRDRLRVLLPSDTESYYQTRELVPADLLDDVRRAKIVITNYHAFKLRETMEVSKGGRALLEGRTGEPLKTLETEGQMVKRVASELMGIKGVLVLNDEAHHCYREKPKSPDEEEETLKGDDRAEAEKNREAARLWISGLEAVQRRLGLTRVIDLSATPFFLRGSGYDEGTLFPWTMSDFSLMDAIECGIVKLPRVPVADNIPGSEVPKFRNLWDNIRDGMPKKGASKQKKAGGFDTNSIPQLLMTALEALYGHYKKVYEAWRQAGIGIPPCFIVVCNNTSASKLVYDYIAGVEREDGTLVPGRLELFRNTDENGNWYARPRTILIDSEQLEAGEIDDQFRQAAAKEIAQFKDDLIQRTGDARAAEKLDDVALLREVMNTVGKEGRLGEQVRCVVSVSMLTEGWDANNVTHVLGVRAFGTQLLCEQVIGRALRRRSYDLNEDGLFNVEYADILGIPFDFTAEPVITKPPQPRDTVTVKAMSPERDHLEIRFPNVSGYRVEPSAERLTATFTDDHIMVITPEDIGPTQTENAGIVGRPVELTLDHQADDRMSAVSYELTKRMLNRFRDEKGELNLTLFGQMNRIVRQWLDSYLVCKGGTYPAHVLFPQLAERACERLQSAILRGEVGEKARPAVAILDPYNREGSTRHVRFTTSKTDRYQTSPDKCHLNWVILDSDWEAEFCRVAEAHPRVLAYVKNHNLGFEVPYRSGAETRRYRPDFLVLVDDGRGKDNPLHLIVEIKGYRKEDAKEKKLTMETYWVPGINRDGRFGRWAFAEFADVWDIGMDFEKTVAQHFEAMLSTSAPVAAGAAR